MSATGGSTGGRETGGPRLADLLRLSAREWSHHPWRHAVALLAVALGVALAYSVHLINRSALAEFSDAVRSTRGEPDLSLQAGAGRLPERWLPALQADPVVRAASPVLALETLARGQPGAPAQRVRVLGLDALAVAALAPELLPRPAAGEPRLAMLDPQRVFLNAAARERLGVGDGDPVSLRHGEAWATFQVAGWIAAGGGPLLVLDVAAAQHRFGADGTLSRIDLRLVPGASPAALRQRLALPPSLMLQRPDEAGQQVSQLSRAYRVNLTVLALVALFVGAFLVYSVVALSVAQRTPTLALLGVLGLAAAARQRWVLAECALLGAAGGLLGLAAGAGLAMAALRWLAGDLGGGYFPGITPALQADLGSALGFAALGVLSAVVGGWMPSRQARRLQPAQALKGLGGDAGATGGGAWAAPALLAAGVLLAFVPPIGGLPIAAYASVACLLFGGVAVVPWAVDALLAAWPAPRAAAALLAVRRARWQRATATAAVAGVVASLALSSALTIMVASFREGVSGWLTQMLPADLYARTAAGMAAADTVWLDPSTVAAAAHLPGVERLQPGRVRLLQLAPDRPPVALLARPVGESPQQALPLIDGPAPPANGRIGVYVSEAVQRLYGVHTGDTLALPLNPDAGVPPTTTLVRGVWRDYARQFGAIVIDRGDYVALTGDRRVNELALWLTPGADAADVQGRLLSLTGDAAALEIASAAEIRAVSLHIFDRSFAVTTYLQVVAVAVGLVGVSASLSAQVLARRKEFGLLAHLGLTRRQVTALVAGETAAWLAAGVLIGLALGVAISVVLVHVVNPQSFHWTMALVLPGGRLAALAAAVAVAGVLTAAASARGAAGRAAVLSVKEDW